MMLIIMLPSMIQNHGIYIIRGDYVDQYIPRLIKAKEIIFGGAGNWDWYNFLGASYNKVSIIFSLNFLCLLFPEDLIPYAVTYMHAVRIALIAMSSFVYLRYMVKDQKNAFLGAFLYTFSSYTFVCFEFMQFLEALWSFPLLLLAAEKMFRCDNYKHQLVLASFLCCLTNFYFFVFSTISFSVYFLCRFFLSEEWKEKRYIKFFLIAVLEYVIGFLCALVLIAPYLYRMFVSSGSIAKVGKRLNNNFLYDEALISRLFSMFVPAGSNRFDSFGQTQWKSLAAYVPVFGLSMVIGTFFNKKMKNKKWLVVLNIISILFVVVAGVGLVYNMFSSLYTRFLYAMVMFFVLSTVLFLDNYDDGVAKKGTYIASCCLTGLLLLYHYFYSYLSVTNKTVKKFVQYHEKEVDVCTDFKVYITIAALVMYICLIAFVLSPRVRKHAVPVILSVIVCYGCSYTVMNIRDEHLLDYYRTSKIDLETLVEKYYIEKPEIPEPKNYRVEHSRQLRNFSYATATPTITVFESVRNSYATEMAKCFDMYVGTVTILPQKTNNAMRTLLGVKYYYNLYSDDPVSIPKDFSYLKTENGVKIYENKNYLGLGFSYDSYITRSEFKKIQQKSTAADIMLNTLVVEDKDEAFVSPLLKKYQSGTLCKDRISLQNFKTSSSGFTASVYTEKPQVIYVSVPYEDEGWTATINGKEVDFIRANVGCMAFITQAGENNIEFYFRSPAQNIGILGSCVGIAIFVSYAYICKSVKKKKISKEAQIES